jgi:hypothetical protein
MLFHREGPKGVKDVGMGDMQREDEVGEREIEVPMLCPGRSRVRTRLA